METTAFEATLRELRPRLGNLLRRARVPPEDAEDLLQEAFLSLFVHWDSVRERGGYLVSSIRHLCWRYHRKRHQRLAQAVDEAVLETLAAPQPPPQAQFEARHDARRHLARLTPKQRRAVCLRKILGLTPREISQVTGIRADSSRRLVRAAVAELARHAAGGDAPRKSKAPRRRRARPGPPPEEGEEA